MSSVGLIQLLLYYIYIIYPSHIPSLIVGAHSIALMLLHALRIPSISLAMLPFMAL
jgi:hypothetical protein